ncbi:uncharacterized protein [Temnothorax longispinosus]|uniref:uncharacterized protein isoform X3 n=1 Tax=Temnothorax longispinosus TaxID=300112 RepID=UPI003A99D38E
MIRIETQFLIGLNRILLLAIGLWPYQQSRLTQFQFNLFFTILMTCIIFQLTTFITALKYTSDLVVAVLSPTSFLTVFIIIYLAFRVNIETVKELLIQLQHVCNELRDKNEIAIIEKYGYISKCYTVALIAFSIGGTAMIATGAMGIAFFKFFCGMFQISSYRIERAVKIIQQNITLKNKILKSEDLISAIDLHRQVIRLSKYFISKFEIMFFCLAHIFVISLCFNFAHIFQIVLSEQATKKALWPMMFAASNILYLFISNSLGQNMTDHNNYVFDTVYRVEWYVTPLHIQRIILFLLLKGAKIFTMNVGGLFTPSLECFAMLVKASVSYFTVILSTQ